MVQNFKGDAVELKMQAVADPTFDRSEAALDDFYQNGFEANSFLLMLYDNRRMPFSERINRDTFILFIKEALNNFPFTGTFDTYLFILREIFGDLSEITFTVAAPGKLQIEINAISNTEFDYIGRELVGTSYEVFEMIDSEGNQLVFRGITGIETEYELNLLFSEIMPAGIIPTIALSFYSRFDAIVEDSSGDIYDLMTMQGDQIIFTEIGG